jgi:hypothetical protein
MVTSPITDMRARNLVIIRFSFCPLGLLFGVAGPERAKNPAGKTPPPVSDPFDGVESGKNPASLSSKKTATPTRRFNLYKRDQLFIRTRNEPLSVVAMCVCNQDCSPSESIAETQPQPEPALLRLSAIISRERFSTFALMLFSFVSLTAFASFGARV